MSLNHGSTDRIEKQIRLKAPRAHVWGALTAAAEFGRWFGVKMSGVIAPGATLRGPLTIKGYERLIFEATVDAFEAQTRCSSQWHPYAVEADVDYSSEPTTLVVFTLAEVTGGTLLTVVDTGFDKIPASRRARAFEMNSNGWAAQIENIKRHLGA